MAKTIKAEETKEKPRYKTQRQYEKVFKGDYNTMLLKMNIAILKVAIKT